MISIEDLQLVAAVSRAASLSEAARDLTVTPAALSMRLRKLEAHLGIKLANRDARRLRLTDEGERLAEEGRQMLVQLEALTDSLQPRDGLLQGRLKLAAPFGYGRLRIAPLLARFAKLHPDLKLELELKETPWPDGQDCDVVIHIGSVNDSSWTARTLAINDRWLCASPGYLREYGIPAAPSDLANHRCICIQENDEHSTFWHVSNGTSKESIRIAPILKTNDGTVARRWAEQDLGLVLRSEWDVGGSIASGNLIRVLETWKFDSAAIQLLIPTLKYRSKKVQALSIFIQSSLGYAVVIE
ncbi:LysR family transcriptional regulator [Pseudomonas gingeri]|uniref:LysR family transcriptional regulator n=1 Tax=Pseudomonas gingeri TaxID=117681 RepID=UPI00159F884A|nr:LysR family transcriptional regulator [Pseudomonas gingeri]NWD66827.1 LysR family transcriptional regulator [Pseudomonas gingeri]